MRASGEAKLRDELPMIAQSFCQAQEAYRRAFSVKV